MTRSGFVKNTPPLELPKGYVFVFDSSIPLIAPTWQLGVAVYSGGIVSTAEDLARFLSLQFQTGSVGGSQILSADSLRQMRATFAHGGAGLGWWGANVAGHQMIQHSGGHLGFLAAVGAVPDLKLGIVVMTNSGNPAERFNVLSISCTSFLKP